jgi:hypothetical protein
MKQYTHTRAHTLRKLRAVSTQPKPNPTNLCTTVDRWSPRQRCYGRHKICWSRPWEAAAQPVSVHSRPRTSARAPARACRSERTWWNITSGTNTKTHTQQNTRTHTGKSELTFQGLGMKAGEMPSMGETKTTPFTRLASGPSCRAAKNATEPGEMQAAVL